MKFSFVCISVFVYGNRFEDLLRFVNETRNKVIIRADFAIIEIEIIDIVLDFLHRTGEIPFSDSISHIDEFFKIFSGVPENTESANRSITII